MTVPRLIALACATLPCVAQADFHNIPADLRFTCNAHGAIVDVVDGRRFYLGKACDAANAEGDTGTWYWVASAFVVDIDGQADRFANEIPCDMPYCLYRE